MIGSYSKAIIALAIGVLAWVGTVLASEAADITNTEWSELITALVVVLGVYAVPNTVKPPA